MSCSPAAMRATALRRISSLTGTEASPRPGARRGSRDAVCPTWGPTYRRTARTRAAGHVPGRCSPARGVGDPLGQRHRLVAVERRLEAVGDVALGPERACWPARRGAVAARPRPPASVMTTSCERAGDPVARDRPPTVDAARRSCRRVACLGACRRRRIVPGIAVSSEARCPSRGSRAGSSDGAHTRLSPRRPGRPTKARAGSPAADRRAARRQPARRRSRPPVPRRPGRPRS